jgi:hypothetical protein
LSETVSEDFSVGRRRPLNDSSWERKLVLYMSGSQSYRAQWLTLPATVLQIKVDINLPVSLTAPSSVPIVTKIAETRSATIAVSKALAISRKTALVSLFSSKPTLTPFNERGQLQHCVRSGSELKLPILRHFAHATSQ